MVIVLFFGCCHAQKLIKPLGFNKDSISINTNIKLHDAVSFENLIITFEKVIVDSRCPKGVQCVRAGEAKVLISIFEDGIFLENKVIIIDPEGYIFKNNMFYKKKTYELYLSALHPHPKADEKITDETYNADFFVMRNYRQ
ncbi:hypothetical protein WNY78_00180 [Psychroserpens sp. AS72]